MLSYTPQCHSLYLLSVPVPIPCSLLAGQILFPNSPYLPFSYYPPDGLRLFLLYSSPLFLSLNSLNCLCHPLWSAFGSYPSCPFCPISPDTQLFINNSVDNEWSAYSRLFFEMIEASIFCQVKFVSPQITNLLYILYRIQCSSSFNC